MADERINQNERMKKRMKRRTDGGRKYRRID
jgi:anaerobic selenocysteine-containing dehydrogenase